MGTTDIAVALANVQSLNLDFLVADLERQGVSKQDAVADVEAYRQFLETCAAYPSQQLVPTKQVDRVWHAHLFRPQRYYEDCMVCFRRILDHVPSVFGTEAYNEAWAMTRKLAPFGRDMPVDPRGDGPMSGADCYRPPVIQRAGAMEGADCYLPPVA